MLFLLLLGALPKWSCLPLINLRLTLTLLFLLALTHSSASFPRMLRHHLAALAWLSLASSHLTRSFILLLRSHGLAHHFLLVFPPCRARSLPRFPRRFVSNPFQSLPHPPRHRPPGRSWQALPLALSLSASPSLVICYDSPLGTTDTLVFLPFALEALCSFGIGPVLVLVSVLVLCCSLLFICLLVCCAISCFHASLLLLCFLWSQLLVSSICFVSLCWHITVFASCARLPSLTD
jgi:hypothetical protein